MKKIITLLTILISLIGLKGYSQILTNTKWTVYDKSSIFFYYFNFNSDTIAYSKDNISYTNFATYTENGSIISIIDLADSNGCPIIDTGIYAFQIKNDTLKFNLLKDSCKYRQPTMALYHWVKSYLGIRNENLSPTLEIYPNPSNGKFTINSNGAISSIEVYNLTGKLLYSDYNLKRQNSVDIDLSNLQKGIYVARISDGKQVLTEKVIIQ